MRLPDEIVAEMEKSHVPPSPGYTGAFKCNICGSTNLGVMVNKETWAVAIICGACGNYQEFDNGDHS